MLFSIIPAAGRSLRMGSQHKLLLPWKGSTVIDRVLSAWTESRVDRVIIIVRGDDRELQAACRRWSDVDVVTPEVDPEDMKRSVQLGLHYVKDQLSPTDADRWMVAPADLPTLTAGLIDQVVEASGKTSSILVPRFGGRRGHPVSFPWSLAQDAFGLKADEGINRLTSERPVDWLDLPADQRPEDIDTPEDYSRLNQRPAP